jgi:hypothetical protein
VYCLLAIDCRTNSFAVQRFGDQGVLLDVQASPGVDGDAVMKLLFSASSLERRKMQKAQIGKVARLAGGLESQNARSKQDFRLMTGIRPER